MAFDRETTLKKAEKLLRQGRLDAAIAEYQRVVEDQPRDWNTANTLGDLFLRAGQTDLAIAQYSRIADHFSDEGFYPKAAALYKKILKITSDDERTQLQLADVSSRQGLIADARTLLNAVAARRRNRSDRRGEAEILVRLGDLDPADFGARLAAARTRESMGETDDAARRYRAIHDELLEKGRRAEALDALRHVARLNPNDREVRGALARAALASGDADAARTVLDRQTAGNDPGLLLMFADVELRSGRLESGREALAAAIASDPAVGEKALELGWSLLETKREAAFACVDAIVDDAVRREDFAAASAALQQFVARVPGEIPALLKLVEVCVDGGFESAMYSAQEQLTDAYLAAGQAAEARVIAEDLVAREPWEDAHIQRFRRALVMLRVPEPDTVIAERLSGDAPFMAKDPFVDVSELPPVPVENASDSTDAAVSTASPERRRTDEAVQETTRQVPASESPQTVDEIDLTGALGTLDSTRTAPAANTLDEVFQRKRDEATSTPDYSQQYMTLARTFLEMGQVDEAIPSLRAAAKGLGTRFEAAARLGRIHRDRGETAEAIEWLERAAEAPAPREEDGHALLYDLGVALDDSGEVARALAVFLELQANAGDYRDVPSRIDRLARVQAGG